MVRMMENILNKLKEQLDFYYAGTLSKEALGKWAEKQYYEILKGKYVELQRIIVYPFLKTISRIHIAENEMKDEYPCSKEEMAFIHSVLHGKKEFSFHVEISIPIQVYNMYSDLEYYDIKRRDQYLELYKELIEYKKLNVPDVTSLNKSIDSMKLLNDGRKTIQGIIESDIYKICQIILNNVQPEIELNTEYRLYTNKVRGNELIDKLMDCLKCYLGEKSFHVIVSYDAGSPDILLLY